MDTNDDWRHELHPRLRRRALKRIMNDINKYHDIDDEEELQELEKFCQSFEQKTFASATSKADYNQKIAVMKFEMRRKLKEEIHQKIKMFKEVYMPELIEMYQLIANRHQQIQMLKQLHLPELTEMFFKFASEFQQQDSLSQRAESDNHKALDFFKGMFHTISSRIALLNYGVHGPSSFRNSLVGLEKNVIIFINANRPGKMCNMQPGQVPSQALLSMPQQQSQLTQVCSNENQLGSQWEFQEVYRKIQMLKEMYMGELYEMHQKITNKIWQIDNYAEPSDLRFPRPKPYADERPKLLKIKEILERIITFLWVSKCDISPAMKEELPSFEKQIITLVSVNRSIARVHGQVRLSYTLYVPSATGNVEEFMVSEGDFDCPTRAWSQWRTRK